MIHEIGPIPEWPLHVKVAQALGWTHCGQWWPETTKRWYGTPPGGVEPGTTWDPTIPHFDTDWREAGALIERYQIGLAEPGYGGGPDQWCATYRYPDGAGYEYGRTAIIAVCNLIIAMGKAGRL